jgi:hypothetical protein
MGYQSDDLLKVKREWYRKLAKQGFEDLERIDKPDGFIQPEIINKAAHREQNAHSYYQMCHEILRNEPFWLSRRDMDYKIFELHTEGKSTREIEAYLKEKSYRPVTWVAIHKIIKKIKKDYEAYDAPQTVSA